jgi:hypothetical protein
MYVFTQQKRRLGLFLPPNRQDCPFFLTDDRLRNSRLHMEIVSISNLTTRHTVMGPINMLKRSEEM